MCVIIKREPNIIIPDDKISSACKVNPDGFGFSVVDRGKLETIKLYRSGGNDESEVKLLLEQSKNQLAFLHLRYTTAGKTNEENCHPFQVFKGDNYEVQFMHNGTLSKFSKGRDDDHSDTWHFNEEILKPLIRAFYEVDGAGVLLNPVVKNIISEFKGASAFMFYDNEGNHLAIENSSCKQFEGWWASNEYSFNRTHREPVTTTYYGRTSPYADAYDSYDDYWNERLGNQHYRSAAPSNASKASTPNDLDKMFPKPQHNDVAAKKETPVGVATKVEAQQIGKAVVNAKTNAKEPAKLTHPEDRYTFCEMAEFADLKDIQYLTEGDIYDMVTELPLAATALIMDLIHELWQKDQAAKKKPIQNTSNVTRMKVAS